MMITTAIRSRKSLHTLVQTPGDCLTSLAEPEILRRRYAKPVPGIEYGVSSFFVREDVISLFIGAVFHDIRIAPVRPRISLLKQLGSLLLGDLVIEGLLVTARVP